MASQKFCPKCNIKCGNKTKICKNEECGYVFTSSVIDDTDDEDDDEIEIPERSCSVCNDKFSPKLSKRTVLGDPYWVWMYKNYCSASCHEIGEEKLFDFIYGLIYSSENLKNSKSPSTVDTPNTFEKILATEVFSYNGSPEVEIPKDIIKIVNPENFVLRKTDGNNVDTAAFIKLTSPRFPVKKKSTTVNIGIDPTDSTTSENPLNIEKSAEFSSTFERPAPKKIKPIEEDYDNTSIEKRVADTLDIPLGTYVNNFLKQPENLREARTAVKPGKGKKQCPFCQAIVSGGRLKQCPQCGKFFPKKD